MSVGRCIGIVIEALEDMISQSKKPYFFTKMLFAFSRLEYHREMLNKLFDSDSMLLRKQEKKVKEKVYSLVRKGLLYSNESGHFSHLFYKMV